MLESIKKFGKKFNENIHRPDVEDLDVPVTEEEEVLAQYIEECIEEEFGIGCSCETHNPGEEMHLEIFIGEDEYDEDTDLNELCADLEELVNQIGKQEKQDSGTEWGDASFSPQGDYIYGEVWPLEGEYAINPKGELAKESTKKFGKKFNESADQTLEDIIDNIVTLSILSRDAESAEEMFRDLKQELFSMGLFSG